MVPRASMAEYIGLMAAPRNSEGGADALALQDEDGSIDRAQTGPGSELLVMGVGGRVVGRPVVRDGNSATAGGGGDDA